METNSKKILAALPDFEDYMKLAEEIKRLSHAKMMCEKDIKEMESRAFQRVMNEPAYFVNNKAISVSYFENAYKHAGINREIIPFREELAQLTSELDAKKSQFEIYRMMQDMYRALAYQEKSMS
jgi:hypothetical protein